MKGTMQHYMQSPKVSIDGQKLFSRYLHNSETRQQMLDLFKQPMFRHRPDLNIPIEESRKVSTARLRQLGAAHIVSVRDMRRDPMKYFAWVESLLSLDLAACAKMTIHYNMFGACVLNLGTEVHEKFLDEIDSLEGFGCFAMSELGHGSNARQLETTARYDPATDEFVIHTPTDNAQKYWIGNAKNDARYAAVFAQLNVGGVEYGVHVFIVPLRNTDGSICTGVRIAEVGHKMGLNNIDQGRIWFDHVRIPRTNLLNRFGSVDRNGSYSSPIKSSGKRFLANIGELLIARLVVCLSCVQAAKVGLTVAIRYAASRVQFALPDKPEHPILEFSTHQQRLLPLLSTTYAIAFVNEQLKRKYADRVGSSDMEDLHVLVSGMKAYASWHNLQTLQICRECCGGQGYLTRNLICSYRVDMEPFVTLDGDNTVLMQMVAKALLDSFTNQFKKWSKDYFEVISYVRKEVQIVAKEQNPLLTRVIAQQHLRGSDFQLHSLQFREHCLLRDLAFKLQKITMGLGEKRQSQFEAWNTVLPEAVALGKAHVERLLLEAFVEAENKADPVNKDILGLLRSLFALSRIASDDWFVIAGNLSGMKAKAVKRQVGLICSELKEHAVPLVNAFGLPEWYFEGTIASDWQKLNQWENRHAPEFF
eukprot:GILJ01006400.1.p1 GENE.GILJ01006400.1~~GILJ01006400.1.p1  ORF type:complete len:725 (+),score=118.57 GILJ01006400.1:235-2175(+)